MHFKIHFKIFPKGSLLIPFLYSFRRYLIWSAPSLELLKIVKNGQQPKMEFELFNFAQN
jgi:hypothetical protein